VILQLCASLWNNKKCFDTVDARYKHEDYHQQFNQQNHTTPMNDKVQFKVELRRNRRTHIFYSVNVFLMFRNDSQSYYLMYIMVLVHVYVVCEIIPFLHCI
jgi:hypothetical protein